MHEHQAAYYTALQTSTEQADSAPFVAFMLDRILEALRTACLSGRQAAPQATPQVTPQVERLLLGIRGEMSREALELQDRKSFRERYLKPALEQGLIQMSVPDKPHSRLQRYRLTESGRVALQCLRANEAQP